VTLQSIRVGPNEQALAVMDQAGARLLIYTVNLARKRLELGAALSMNQVFGGPAPTRPVIVPTPRGGQPQPATPIVR
jgi:hypothetical protein